MALAPKLYPAGLADRNSNSAYEKLKFIEEHYEELMQAYQVIMEHLKIVNESNQVELPDDLVTYDSDNNVLKSGENTIQISADVPDNIVTTDGDGIKNSADTGSWNSDTYGDYRYYNIKITVPEEDSDYNAGGTMVTVPYTPLTVTTPYGGGGDRYIIACGEYPEVLFNVYDLVTVNNISQYTSNFITSDDLPDMSDYVETSEVANEAGKIPRFNSQGHLVLPDGTEIWCEDNE